MFNPCVYKDITFFQFHKLNKKIKMPLKLWKFIVIHGSNHAIILYMFSSNS